MFSEDVIGELTDRVREIFAPLDQDTRLAVERSLRVQLGIGDRMDVDPWSLFASRLYRTVHMIEDEWSTYQRRRNDLRRGTSTSRN